MPRDARSRFEETRRAVARLHDVQVMIMNGCEDWRPSSVSPRRAIGDPTANRAIRNVDDLEGRLRALREEESELVGFIGESLVVIRAVRDGLGDKYADVLEWRYVDCLSYDRIRDDYGMPKATAHRFAEVAFDWIDSIGVTRILAGDLEI